MEKKKKQRTYALPDEVASAIVAERPAPYGTRSYVSLFSSAGVGCYGFKEAGFCCVATVEMLERRLKIQRYNQKCMLSTGYICGDMTLEATKQRVRRELQTWRDYFGVDDLDALVATPPCQGMSVANHKKGDELRRNSLVVESIALTCELRPKVFVFENVRAFLTSTCTDTDGADKPIGEAIATNLGGDYNILSRIVNFKDYGCPSSRTRTLVIGVRRDLPDVTPYDLFPSRSPERTLRQVIGHLPALRTMGEITPGDIYHNFRSYAPHMEAWIDGIGEGQSAFDNPDPERRPHTIRGGVAVANARKNGDKYTRQHWDKVAPCIHTRNDQLASQNTVHPTDNRVFSLREVMLMMSVPESFRWSDIPPEQLNALPLEQKRAFLKREEMNIRQNLGEAVPTVIFRQIAQKLRRHLDRPALTNAAAANIVATLRLDSQERLLDYVERSDLPFARLSRIVEMANAERDNTAAYYTRQDICFSMVSNLPDAREFASLSILEPSTGVGNFLPSLIEKYASVASVAIDVVDINPASLALLRRLLRRLAIPPNVHINFIEGDFLKHDFSQRYDIVIGNPPYMKLTGDRALAASYKAASRNKDTNNIFAFFIEKALRLGRYVSLIVPKSLVNAPEFNATRELMNSHAITHLIDYGEKAFKGVKIETVAFTIDTQRQPQQTTVCSYITRTVRKLPQAYIADPAFPYWLLYRDEGFDAIARSMDLGIFRSYRDRVITKSVTKPCGRIRVLKSRNIGNNQIIDIPDYDCYVDDASAFDVAKYMNHTECVLLPNLTYNPRACFLPKNCIADGSVAILSLCNPAISVTAADLAFYSSPDFARFYAVARNLGSRSLNIDNNSVFFFGKLRTTSP